MNGTRSQWRMRAHALAPGQSAKFSLRCGRKTMEGFVVNHDGRLYAYVNRCAHVGTPLDMWPNEFFTEDGRHLICATHGAVYQPATGLCIAGPCPGASLTPLAVSVEHGEVVVSCPDSAGP